MFSSDNPMIRSMTDNFIVRQLSGRLVDYPVGEDEWADLLDAAIHNLKKLSFVGLQEAFAVDFNAVRTMLKLPSPSHLPRNNVTTGNPQPVEEGVHEIVERLVYWDDILYKFSRESRVRALS
jgi:hypothetical protein